MFQIVLIFFLLLFTTNTLTTFVYSQLRSM